MNTKDKFRILKETGENAIKLAQQLSKDEGKEKITSVANYKPIENPFISKANKEPETQVIIDGLTQAMEQLRNGEISPAQANLIARQAGKQIKQLRYELKKLKGK